MNCNVRNQHKVAIHLDGTRYKAIALANDESARNRKGSVKPARQNHSAVALGVEAHIMSAGLGFILILECKGGRIRMACRNTEALRRTARHTERNDRRAVKGQIIALPCFKLPLLFGRKLRKVLCLQHLRNSVNTLKRRRAFFYKCNQILCNLDIFGIHTTLPKVL